MALFRILVVCWTGVASALKNNFQWTTNRFSFNDIVSLSSSTMDDELQTVGSSLSESADSLIVAPLNQRNDVKPTVQRSNQHYIEEHPEIRGIIDDFISSAMAAKPVDFVDFGCEYFTDLRRKIAMKNIYPLVIAGPSGVGKGTLINLLMTRYPNLFGFSVSHTTRKPRPGEINGVHYHFVELEEMERAVLKGEFLEHARVFTNMYGTSAKAVQEVQSRGKICILDIDIQGVESVKTSPVQCKYMFISPPSLEQLEHRLRSRGTESEESILVRLGTAAKELSYGNAEGNFDAIVVNSDLESALADIISSLQSWYPNLNFTPQTDK